MEHFYTQNTDVMVASINNEVVMMNTQTGKYFGLNETASQIWQLLSEKKTVTQLIDDLHERYDLTRESDKESINELVNQLLEHDLIHVASA